MKPRPIEHLLWLTAFGAAVLALVRIDHALPTLSDSQPTNGGTPSAVRPVGVEALHTAAAEVVETDPFRLERHPAAVPFDPQGGTARGAAPPPAPPPRPALALGGILGGPPWEAILEGIPARTQGMVIQSGESIGDLRVRSIGPDTVVVDGPDTTWILTLKRPWQ